MLLPNTVTPFNIDPPKQLSRSKNFQKVNYPNAKYIDKCKLCGGTILLNNFRADLYGRCTVCGRFYYSEETISVRAMDNVLQILRWVNETTVYEIPPVFNNINSTILHNFKRTMVMSRTLRNIYKCFKKLNKDNLSLSYSQNISLLCHNLSWIFPVEYFPGLLAGLLVYTEKNQVVLLLLKNNTHRTKTTYNNNRKNQYTYIYRDYYCGELRHVREHKDKFKDVPTVKELDCYWNIKLFPYTGLNCENMKDIFVSGLDDILGFRKDRSVFIHNPQYLCQRLGYDVVKQATKKRLKWIKN